MFSSAELKGRELGELEADGVEDSASTTRERYMKRKRQIWDEDNDRGRELCSGCQRPPRVCVCDHLPPAPLDTSTRFVILQHPVESRRPTIGTVPLVLRCLKNCRRVVIRSEPLSPTTSDLRQLLGFGRGEGVPLLLYPSKKAEFIEDIAGELRRANAADGDFPPGVVDESTRTGEAGPRGPSSSSTSVVVLIDGSWSQAKQILRRYPCLVDAGLPPKPAHAAGPPPPSPGDLTAEGKLCRAVTFRSAGSGGYVFRREPSEECLSTLESVAYTLEVLEASPEGLTAAAHLRAAFSAMVSLQVELRDKHRHPRFVNRRSRTANRNSDSAGNTAQTVEEVADGG